jgi:HD-GYP domain-containing protein (c-di-GMP phosphodiesterase class II)
MHPVYAYEMLSPIEFLRPAIDIPYCHHEKWDGSGYPRKLKGVQIPISARIFAVVDVWDALRSDRPYRQRWSVDKVVNHVKSLSGSHFDPQVLDAFINELRKGSFDDLITGNEYPSGATMDSTEEDQEEKDSAA